MMKDYKGTLRESSSTVSAVLLLSLLFIRIDAFAPPHPDHVGYESASHYRLQNNITFDFTPSFLHPEVCKYLSQEDCQHSDESMRLQHETHRYNQRLLEANPNFDLNILVLLLLFTDHADRPLPEPYEYQLLLNLRVAEYLKANSYDKYRVWFDVIPWTMTDNTELHYSFGKSGRTKDFQRAFHPLLDQLWESGEIPDWSIYDNNGDGILDNLMVLTSSYPAEVGGLDCTNQRKIEDRIWSHALADVDRDNWVSKDGSMRSNGYTIASALSGTCNSVPAETGVITHEYMHAIANVPDLYDTSTDPETGELIYRGKGGIGSYDIMSNPYGTNQDNEDFPSHLSAWTKIQMGWLEPTVLNTAGAVQDTYTLRPSELFPDVLQINLENFFGYEYLLIENRQRELFDIRLHGAGLCIFHVDDSLNSQSYRGFPGQEGWPGNAKHYQIALLQADGKYDMERFQNRGDAGDFWQKGMTLGPNKDGNTYPNTDTYGTMYGVFPSGVTVTIVDQVGKDMILSIGLPSELMGAPMKHNETEDGFVTPPKATHSPFRISGKFEASWFKEGNDNNNENNDNESVEEVDAVPPQEIGTGFVERPPREDEWVVEVDNEEENAENAVDENTASLGDPFAGDLFETVGKERVNNTSLASADVASNSTEALEEEEEIANEWGENSLFDNLFTNTSKDKDINSETESDSMIDSTTIPPTKGEEFEDTSETTITDVFRSAAYAISFLLVLEIGLALVALA